MNGEQAETPEAALSDALHALAQPLTALGFIIDLGLLQTDPAAVRQALAEAGAECRRAVSAVEHLRTVVAAQQENAQ